MEEIIEGLLAHEITKGEALILLKKRIAIKDVDFEFTSKGSNIEEGVGVWTDGLMISSDRERNCAYRLVKGNTYKVEVTKLD
jgi:hypothetical protein